MTRKFIATILAAAVAVTTMGSTAQAHHKNDDLIKFLGAATTLIIIGNALKNSNHNYGYSYQYHSPNKGKVYYNHKPKGKPALPGGCIRTAKNKKGQTYRVFSRHCLKNHYKAVHKLPNSCAIKYRNLKGKVRGGFGINCLKNKGFKIH